MGTTVCVSRVGIGVPIGGGWLGDEMAVGDGWVGAGEGGTCVGGLPPGSSVGVAVIVGRKMLVHWVAVGLAVGVGVGVAVLGWPGHNPGPCNPWLKRSNASSKRSPCSSTASGSCGVRRYLFNQSLAAPRSCSIAWVSAPFKLFSTAVRNSRSK